MIKGVDIEFMSECLKAYFANERDFAGVPILICGDPGLLLVWRTYTLPVKKSQQFVCMALLSNWSIHVD